MLEQETSVSLRQKTRKPDVGFPMDSGAIDKQSATATARARGEKKMSLMEIMEEKCASRHVSQEVHPTWPHGINRQNSTL